VLEGVEGLEAQVIVTIELARRMPTGVVRVYALTEQAAIDGHELLVENGRQGGRSRRRREHFPSRKELEHRVLELLARRRRHAYLVLSADEESRAAYARELERMASA
jgi:predicted DNA-binding WGR domain protein